MFSSQTSSFQESIDVEEKDTDFDQEELAGYSPKIQQINSYYSIYYYQNTRWEVCEDASCQLADP